MNRGLRQGFLRLATLNGRRSDSTVELPPEPRRERATWPRPQVPAALPWPSDQLAELTPLLRRARDGLILTGDKTVLATSDGRTALAFARQGGTRLALGGPIGAADGDGPILTAFLADARRQGERVAFYGVTPDELDTLLGPRLVATKIGERALLDLATFSLKGPRFQNLRTRRSKLAREGIAIELVPPDRAAGWLDRLAPISLAWLHAHGGREKRFSLGSFDPAYLAGTHLLVAHRDGQPIGFLNLVLAERAGEALVDLMRCAPDAPAGAMEALITTAALELQALGVRRLDLGCAPLAGLPSITEAPFWGRLGRLVAHAGRHWYDFHGLRTFKEKFHPEWEPVYLVHQKGALLQTLKDAALLIAGGWTGLVRKRAA